MEREEIQRPIIYTPLVENEITVGYQPEGITLTPQSDVERLAVLPLVPRAQELLIKGYDFLEDIRNLWPAETQFETGTVHLAVVLHHLQLRDREVEVTRSCQQKVEEYYAQQKKDISRGKSTLPPPFAGSGRKQAKLAQFVTFYQPYVDACQKETKDREVVRDTLIDIFIHNFMLGEEGLRKLEAAAPRVVEYGLSTEKEMSDLLARASSRLRSINDHEHASLFGYKPDIFNLQKLEAADLLRQVAAYAFVRKEEGSPFASKISELASSLLEFYWQNREHLYRPEEKTPMVAFAYDFLLAASLDQDQQQFFAASDWLYRKLRKEREAFEKEINYVHYSTEKDETAQMGLLFYYYINKREGAGKANDLAERLMSEGSYSVVTEFERELKQAGKESRLEEMREFFLHPQAEWLEVLAGTRLGQNAKEETGGFKVGISTYIDRLEGLRIAFLAYQTSGRENVFANLLEQRSEVFFLKNFSEFQRGDEIMVSFRRIVRYWRKMLAPYMIGCAFLDRTAACFFPQERYLEWYSWFFRPYMSTHQIPVVADQMSRSDFFDSFYKSQNWKAHLRPAKDKLQADIQLQFLAMDNLPQERELVDLERDNRRLIERIMEFDSHPEISARAVGRKKDREDLEEEVDQKLSAFYIRSVIVVPRRERRESKGKAYHLFVIRTTIHSGEEDRAKEEGLGPNVFALTIDSKGRLCYASGEPVYLPFWQTGKIQNLLLSELSQTISES